MPTTGGSLALSGRVPHEDAFQVASCVSAGAVILGKVNLHELALGLTTVSSLGGQTLEPVRPDARARRFERRIRRGRCRKLRRVHHGHRHERVDPHSQLAQRHRRPSAVGRVVEPRGHHPVRPHSGYRRTDGADRGGYRDRPRRHGGHDPADPVTILGQGRIPSTYTSSLGRMRSRRARGRAQRVLRHGARGRGSGRDRSPRRRRHENSRRTAVDVTVPNLAAALTASNLLTQELKFYLGDYLRGPPGAAVGSVEELLASGLHASQFQGILDVANAQPDDYLAATTTAPARGASVARRAILAVMDANRLDALVYPTMRRIAPRVGGNQIGSNAGLSAQTGSRRSPCRLVSPPAGFLLASRCSGGRSPSRHCWGSLLPTSRRHHRVPPATTPRGHRGSNPRQRRTGRAAAPAGGVRIDVESDRGPRSTRVWRRPFGGLATLTIPTSRRDSSSYSLSPCGGCPEPRSPARISTGAPFVPTAAWRTSSPNASTGESRAP